MNDTRTLHSSGVISSYFALEGHLLATPSADAYKAFDKSRAEAITLWILRHPLVVDSDAVRRFCDRMAAIEQIQPRVSKLQFYGVDAEGTAFAVFPRLDGHAINTGNIEPAEAERRFITCVRTVEKLHGAGLLCGDLCGSSFWVDRVGDVGFIGVMGSYEMDAAAAKMPPPADTLPYIAPETRAGGGVDAAGDVFAIGVLGYYLFTGRYPYGEGAPLMAADFQINGVERLGKFVAVPPVWAEEVIFKCLDPNPGVRYPNAVAVMKAITHIRQRSYSADKAPVVRGERGATLVGPRSSGTNLTTHKSLAVLQRPEPAPVQPHTRALPVMLGVLVALAAVGVTVMMFLGRGAPPPLDSAAARDVPPELIPPPGGGSLREGGAAISDGQTLQQIQQWSDSDDPIAHYYLAKIAKEARTEEIRRQAESGLLRRARRFGAIRSVEQVRSWLRRVRQGALPPHYEAVLKALDSSLPLDERGTLLRRAYPSEPDFILRLAAAIALDAANPAAYQPVLAQLVGDALELENAGRYSTLGLVVAHPQLATVFGDDIVQKREQLTNDDLLWLLHILAQRNDVNTRAIANLALERGMISPLRKVFLQLVRDKADLPADVLAALIRAAAGALTKDDISSFGRWYDVDAEGILLAVLATTSDEVLLLESFDVLAGKSLTIEPSASLVNWVRSSYWTQRGNFAHVIGVLGMSEKVDPAEIERSFSAFDRIAKNSDVIEILLRTNNAVVVRQVLQRYGEMVELGDKLNLLRNSERTVRTAAIRSIRTNHIGALKFIIDAYEAERDPEVKALYRERFDIIREREGER